jgi:hypothetical protein
LIVKDSYSLKGEQGGEQGIFIEERARIINYELLIIGTWRRGFKIA